MTLPCSRAMVVASASVCSRGLTEICRRYPARWIAGSLSQAGWARRAAETAASTAAASPSGTSAVRRGSAGVGAGTGGARGGEGGVVGRGGGGDGGAAVRRETAVDVVLVGVGHADGLLGVVVEVGVWATGLRLRAARGQVIAQGWAAVRWVRRAPNHSDA